MAVLDVLIYGHPILRKRAQSAEFPNESFFSLARNMIETMQLHEGVGFCATDRHGS